MATARENVEAEVLYNAKQKLAKRFSGDFDRRLGDIYIPPMGAEQETATPENSFSLIDEVDKRLIKAPLRLLLLLGHSGMGKTCLSLYLCKLRWEVLAEEGGDNLPLPVYIYLPNYKEKLEYGLLEQVLKDAYLSTVERMTIRTQPLLLIIDGFDEVPISYKLYGQQGWGNPGLNIKVLVCCRPEALFHYNLEALFQARKRYERETPSYQQLYLQSFNDDQIEKYLKIYLEQKNKDSEAESAGVKGENFCRGAEKNLSIEGYLAWLEQLPSLKSLVKIPFFLMAVVNILPSIIQGLSSMGNDAVSQKQFIQDELFRQSLDHWFFRQAQRVKAQGILIELSHNELADYMCAYAQNLADLCMGKKGADQVTQFLLTEKESLTPGLIEPVHNEALLKRYHHPNKKIRQSLLFFENDKAGGLVVNNEAKLVLNLENWEAIRSGCLLRTVGEDFKFWHDSIAKYLVTHKSYENGASINTGTFWCNKDVSSSVVLARAEAEVLYSATWKVIRRCGGNRDPRLGTIYIPPMGAEQEIAAPKNDFLLIDEVVKRLIRTPLRSLLLLGHSGMGKTCLSLHLCEVIREMFLAGGENNLPLPLYIYLPHYRKKLKKGLLGRVLKDSYLSWEEQRVISAEPLLLIIDGFDEVSISHNLYQSQGWGSPGLNIKILICSRTGALFNQNSQALFEAGELFGSEAPSYQQLYLQPFNDNQIKKYLETYVEQKNVGSESENAVAKDKEIKNYLSIEGYLVWLGQLPSLKELVKTPFFLMVVARALPSIIQNVSSMGNDTGTQKQLVQDELFGRFLDHWFFRQAQRVKAQGMLTELSHEELAGYMRAYTQNLAYSRMGENGDDPLDQRSLKWLAGCMRTCAQNLTDLCMGKKGNDPLDQCLRTEEESLKPELMEPVYDKALLERYHHPNKKSRQSLLFFEKDKTGEPLVNQECKLVLNLENWKAIRSGCLLHPAGERFKFLHESIMKYLATHTLGGSENLINTRILCSLGSVSGPTRLATAPVEVLSSAIAKVARQCSGNFDPRLGDIYIPPMGVEQETAAPENGFSLIDEVVKRLINTPLRSLLLLGHSGMGKSCLSLHLCKVIWQMLVEGKEKNLPLPLYIYLPSYKEKLKKGLLGRVLKDAYLSQDEREAISAQSLLLIIDGFGEVPISHNLYQSQGWDKAGLNIKMLVSCRPETLFNQNPQALFEAGELFEWKAPSYQQLFLQPFDDNQIKKYLETYVEQKNIRSESENAVAKGKEIEKGGEKHLSVEDYLIWLEQLPSLKDLAKIPFFLTVISEILPSIIQSLPSLNEDAIAQKQIIQDELFRQILGRWFFQKAQGIEVISLRLCEKQIEGYMRAYAQNLADLCMGKNEDEQLDPCLLTEEESLKPELMEPVYDKALLKYYHHSNKKLRQSLLFFEKDRTGELVVNKEGMPVPKLENWAAIRSGCLLPTIGKRFKFLHQSVAKYLATHKLDENGNLINAGTLRCNKGISSQRVATSFWSLGEKSTSSASPGTSDVTSLLEQDMKKAVSKGGACWLM